MVEFNIDVDFDGDELKEALTEKYAAQIEQAGVDCKTKGCESESFDAEMWTTDSGGFEGAVVCRECNERFELDLEDSQAQDALRDIQSQIKDLENAF